MAIKKLGKQPEIEELRARLECAEATISGIRSGKIDALVVLGPKGEQIFTLKGADRSYRVILEKMAEGAVTLDEEFNILYANSCFAGMVGAPLPEVPGDLFIRFLMPKDHVRFQDLLARAACDNVKDEFGLICADQTKIWVNISVSKINLPAEPDILCLIVTDLTARYNAEKEILIVKNDLEKKVMQRTETLKLANKDLEQSQRMLRSITDNADTALFIMDQGQRCTFMNPAAEELTGFALEEVVARGVSLHEIIHHKRPDGSYYPHNECPIDNAFPTQNKMKGEDVFVHKDGHLYPVAFTASPKRDESGKSIGTIIEVQDITERKRAEEELLRHMVRLEQSNEELEQFAYIAAHDLKEPLHTVINFVDMVAESLKAKLNQEEKECFGFIQRGALDAQELILSLLQYASINQKDYPLKLTDLNLLLKNCLSGLHVLIDESGAVVTSAFMPTLSVNGTHIIQVFSNLISNAIKFRGDNKPEIHIAARQEGEKWIFSVRDNGIGIDPEYKDRIFMIFKRLHSKKKYPGTGIGLAICKKVIEQHGGEIWVESEPGKGSAFCFSLPIMGGGGVELVFSDKKNT